MHKKNANVMGCMWPAPLYGFFQEPQSPVSLSSLSSIILVVSNNDILNHLSRETILSSSRSHRQGIFVGNYLATFFFSEFLPTGTLSLENEQMVKHPCSSVTLKMPDGCQ